MDVLKILKTLPKIEQHIHIVGTTRPRTLLWLLEESNIDMPYKYIEDVEEFYQYKNFNHFISVYSAVNDCIIEEKQFERITYEMLESEASCNVHHVEASFSAPDHVRRGLDYSKMLDAINRGIKRAERFFDIKCHLRIDLVRNYGPDKGMEVLDWIDEKSDNIVAIDIGGTEIGFPPEPYEAVYKRAKEMGLHLVAHAGESAGTESIWGAIKHLNVERIGHGVSARNDPTLMDFLKVNKIAIETCPVSNIKTGVVSSMREHPVRMFYDKGIIVTVNSDDPSMFGTDMCKEYFQLHKHLGFTIPELFQISLNAVNSSFLPEDEKNEIRGKFYKKYNKLVNYSNDVISN